MKFPKNLYGLLFLLLGSCVSDFNPPAQGYENLLVIDALLTNDETPFEVTLSRSYPIDTTAFIPETGAHVKLESESGETFQLQAKGNSGKYVYHSPINPEIGKAYMLIIQTQNGNSYESDYVVMRETPEIDELEFKYDERPTAGLQGAQFFVNTHDPNNNTWYYRWEWDETWEFLMPYASYLKWEDDQIKEREERIYQCWKYGSYSSIEIATSKNLTTDIINDYPLHYVTTETDRLKYRYSLLVKQYSLSEESYNYWKELQNITENLGSLFDPQPSIVVGNIHNIDDPKEAVIGYFDASTVSKKRIFVDRSQLPPVILPNYFSFCTDSIVSEGQIPSMVAERWVLVQETVNDAGFPAYLMSSIPCVDCTLYGSNIRPDYW